MILKTTNFYYIRTGVSDLIMKLFKKYNKYILIGLTIIALSGMFFPLVSISFHFFGTTSMDFGIIDIFQNLRGETPHEVFDLIANHILESDIGRDIILPFAAYILAVILIIITLPFTFTNKFKFLKIAFISAAIILIVYAGIGIDTMSGLIIGYLEGGLADLIGEIAGFLVGDLAGFLVGGLAGLLTSLMDFSNILDIYLGSGYWLTLGTLLLTLILLIIAKIIDFHTKEDDQLAMNEVGAFNDTRVMNNTRAVNNAGSVNNAGVMNNAEVMNDAGAVNNAGAVNDTRAINNAGAVNEIETTL